MINVNSKDQLLEYLSNQVDWDEENYQRLLLDIHKKIEALVKFQELLHNVNNNFLPACEQTSKFNDEVSQLVEKCETSFKEINSIISVYQRLESPNSDIDNFFVFDDPEANSLFIKDFTSSLKKSNSTIGRREDFSYNWLIYQLAHTVTYIKGSKTLTNWKIILELVSKYKKSGVLSSNEINVVQNEATLRDRNKHFQNKLKKNNISLLLVKQFERELTPLVDFKRE